jgi:hypothetical protein
LKNCPALRVEPAIGKFQERPFIQERFELMIGSLVDVEGLAQNDGVILASKIEVKPNIDNPTLFVNFRGVIESLPETRGFIGDWKVKGCSRLR